MNTTIIIIIRAGINKIFIVNTVGELLDVSTGTQTTYLQQVLFTTTFKFHFYFLLFTFHFHISHLNFHFLYPVSELLLYSLLSSYNRWTPWTRSSPDLPSPRTRDFMFYKHIYRQHCSGQFNVDKNFQ